VRPQPGGDNRWVVKGKDSNTEGISGKNKVKNVKTSLVEGRSRKGGISVINCLVTKRREEG